MVHSAYFTGVSTKADFWNRNSLSPQRMIWVKEHTPVDIL